MQITRSVIEQLIFDRFRVRLRYTQDSPIFPDVWLAYYDHLKELSTFRADLILTPHRQSNAAELFLELSQSLHQESNVKNARDWQLASNGETVAASLTLRELLIVALPLTNWWQQYVLTGDQFSSDRRWLTELVGALLLAAASRSIGGAEVDEKMLQRFSARFFRSYRDVLVRGKSHNIVLWSISRNRRAGLTIERSVPATKADAGRRLFDVDGTDINWTILDTGIDAGHPAFRKLDPTTCLPFTEPFGRSDDPASNHTRIVATYDFSRFRDIITSIHADGHYTELMHSQRLIRRTSDKHDQELSNTEKANLLRETERDLKTGRLLDWTVLSPLLRIPHNKDEYLAPNHPHGTHVAGILGAGSVPNAASRTPIGMCPGINLYDIRVLGDDGAGEEFNILAAIQFVRWMNNQRDGMVIHGVNISISIPHEVASYACGKTPICEACERMVAEGTVVVAAAGNQGQALFQSQDG